MGNRSQPGTFTLIALAGATILSLSLASHVRAAVIPAPTPIPNYLLGKGRLRGNAVPSIAAESTSEIRNWIALYTGLERDRFERFMSRGGVYRGLIQDMLAREGVPPDFYYLAMIESGFASRARSRAHAVGIWQFMRGTARMYGLRADSEVDERLDVIRSTRAAARHLRELKGRLGTWYLAMAAYNAGEGRIRRAIRRAGTHDYWKLSRRGFLPEETAQYVPKFQAAMQIARNPSAFGMRIAPAYEFPKVRRAHFAPGMRLSEISRQSGVPLEAIQAMNPHLLHQATPRGGRLKYAVWIPTYRVRE